MNPYFYRITLSRILDGDTLWAYFDLGFRIRLEVNIRMMGYDAPETWRPWNETERTYGHQVTVFLTELLAKHTGNLYCRSAQIDLYGRAEGVLYYKDAAGNYVSINDIVAKFIVDNHITKDEARAIK